MLYDLLIHGLALVGALTIIFSVGFGIARLLGIRIDDFEDGEEE